MKASQKLLKSWWVILSFILFINGFGFIYIGKKHYNRNWIIEGVIYEIPWFFYVIYHSIYGFIPNGYNQVDYILAFTMILMLISIVRSFWVAIKLWDVYDNFDKYAHNPIELTNPNKANETQNNSNGPICCLCIAIIFFIFAIIAMT
jgi:hypothetical protein